MGRIINLTLFLFQIVNIYTKVLIFSMSFSEYA